MHAWYGACDPHDAVKLHTHESFSVGCYKIQQGKYGPKRGKVKVRVRGRCEDSRLVRAEATRICRELDFGTYKGPKTVTVK